MTNEELVLLYQHGDSKQEYIEQLFKQNRKLIASIANSYSYYAEYDDLFQEGYLGLCKAAEMWRDDAGASFSTYACQWIRQHITRYIDNNVNVVRIPAWQCAMIRKMKRAVESFYKDHARTPSANELSRLLGISEKQTKQLLADAIFSDVKSTDEVISLEDDSITIGDTVADPEDKYEQCNEKIQNEQLKIVLWGIVDSLDSEQSKMIHERYEKNRPRKEVAEAIGIPEDKLGLVEAKAFRVLRRPHNMNHLKSFTRDERAYSIGIKCSGCGRFKHTWTSSTEVAVLERMP